jgi:hypothetical protein
VIEVRSYRRVFDLERRIYSVDRLRLNPGGVPVRGVVYFLVALLVTLATAALPLVGTPARALPWFVRDIALPGAAATVLSVIRVEGRVFHLAAGALVRYWGGPRRLAGTRRCGAIGKRWLPREIMLLPDGSDSGLRHMRYTGPGAVVVSVEHERRGRASEHGGSGAARPGLRPVLSLSQQSPQARPLREPQVISLAPGVRMRVRASGGRRG